MEELIKKINELETRVNILESKENKRIKLKKITTLITIFLSVAIAIFYIIIISKIYGNYTKLF